MIYALMGFAAGILSGMGLGGGTVLIPMLTLLAGMEQRSAQGANLAAFLPAASTAVWSHIRAGHVNKALAIPMALWGSLGMAAGAVIALLVSEDLLRKAFAVFLIAMSVAQFISGERKAKCDRLNRANRSRR